MTDAVAPVAQTEVVAQVTKDRVVAYISDKTVIVCGKVDSVATYLQEQLPQTMNATKARALEAFTHLVDLTKSYQQKSDETLLALRSWTNGKIMYVQAEIVEGCKLLKAKALVFCIQVQTALHGLPVPLKYMQQITAIGEQASAATICVKDGIMNAYTKIGGAFVRVRVRLEETKELSEAKLLETLEHVRPIAESHMNSLQDRSILIKGKIRDAAVQIKADPTAARSKAMEECMCVYNALRDALEGLSLETAFIIAAASRVQVLRSKLGDLQVYVKDGVVHATGQVEAGYVHVKASATEVKGSLKFHLLEAVSCAKSQCQDAADATTMKAAVEAGKLKVHHAIDYSKGLAADRKVQAVAGGALIGVGAGGATGFTAGTTAGAACGLLLAPFSLGLSVPIGAAIGASTGTGIGAAMGATLGVIGGRAASSASSNSHQIKQSILQKVRLVSGTGGSDQEVSSK